MWAEHLVYSTAIAVILGMLSYQFTGRDNSWVIILVSYIPDIDFIATILYQLRINIHLGGFQVFHGMFHNIAAMVIFGGIIAYTLYLVGVQFYDALFFCLVGFGAHLFEDALVYPAGMGYMFLWPLSHANMGLGWLTVALNEESYFANADFFHIANTEVLVIGLVFLIVSILIRTLVEGVGWIEWYKPTIIYRNMQKKINN
jgi:hypothetical protein